MIKDATRNVDRIKLNIQQLDKNIKTLEEKIQNVGDTGATKNALQQELEGLKTQRDREQKVLDTTMNKDKDNDGKDETAKTPKKSGIQTPGNDQEYLECTLADDNCHWKEFKIEFKQELARRVFHMKLSLSLIVR